MAISELEDGKNVNINKIKNMRREIKKKSENSQHTDFEVMLYIQV